ncbi:MAG: hypothetical protein HOO96_11100 [Polyangiaceae bacterium]|nr:hypothetical protein [Polyangiaceae bacterium]
MRKTVLGLSAGASALASFFFFVACGTSGSGFGDPNGQNGDGGKPGELGSSDGAATDVIPPPIGNVSGKVTAPEGTIPISDALVYLTKTPPAPIPSTTYCDKCVELSSYAFTYSKPDGTFDLPVYAEGEQYMVTQKGQFRRVRKVSAGAGTLRAVPEDNRLPGKNDEAAGDTIPRMLVMPYAWDKVDRSLNKLGITDFESLQGFNDGPTASRIQKDPAELAKYHVVFFPCAGSVNNDPTSSGNQPYCSVGYMADKTVGSALKQYVQGGGKLYFTDFSYEYVRQNWPGFITWSGETSVVGSACGKGQSNGPAKFDDKGLDAWMQSIGEGTATLQGSYTSILRVNPMSSLDENGNTFTQTPKVWVSQLYSSSARPATVSFQDKCGRVLFSTYHTEAAGAGTLLAQEKALMHVLLEVSACVGVRPTPPR